MNEKIASVIILYHPNYEEISKNISSYLDDIDILYIIGNSKLDELFLENLSKVANIKVLHNDNENLGIAKSLNQALFQAKKDNYNWLLTMDQDSHFEKNDFKLFLNDFKNYNTPVNIIYSPIHNKKFLTSNIIETNFIMTSGNIVNINLAIKIKGFDEKLFIDDVDHDFCFKSLKNKFKIIENQRVALTHNLGKKLGGLTIYEPSRLYYMSRNYLYIYSKYKDSQKMFFKKRNKYLIKFFLIHLIYSNERLKSLKMILLGILDFRKKCFGKINHG